MRMKRKTLADKILEDQWKADASCQLASKAESSGIFAKIHATK